MAQSNTPNPGNPNQNTQNPTSRYTRRLESRWTSPPLREQTGDLHPYALAQDRAADDTPTLRIPTIHEIDRLKRLWRINPTFDIEYASGFEAVRDDLATWHHEQIQRRADILGCSTLMASILEELVHCWIDAKAPVSPLARRVLLSFR